MTWNEDLPPNHSPLGLLDVTIALCRAIPILMTILIGLVGMLVLRVIEWPLFGARRPVTPYITTLVCRASLFFIGLKVVLEGEPMKEHGAVVCNHSSWLDIFACNAFQRIYFVSKFEVIRWPLIGQLAQVVGTVFIERNPLKAGKQKLLFKKRLMAGHKLLFFPEGTSTNGQQVLPFKSTLFAAFFEECLKETCFIQPVAVYYDAPVGKDSRFYCWWGDMSFASHLIHTLSCFQRGTLYIKFAQPLAVKESVSRKTLATSTQEIVEEAHKAAMCAAMSPASQTAS